MDIVVGAKGDRGHPAKLQPLLLSSDDVEKRRRDRRQRFPDDDPQLNRQRGRKEKNHTSNQLKIIVLIWHYIANDDKIMDLRYILQLKRQIFLKIFCTSKSQAKKLILVDRLLLSLLLLLSSSLIPEKYRFVEKFVQILPDRAASKVFLNRKMAQ